MIECSRFSNSQQEHWEAVSSTLGIHFDAGISLRLTANSDSTWPDDRESRLSTSGIIVLLAGGPAVARTIKQKSVASTCLDLITTIILIQQ